MADLFPANPRIKDADAATRLFKESMSGFLTLFDNSPACMSMTTLGKREYVKVNKQFLEKLGYAEKEVIGRTSAALGILDAAEAIKVASILKEKGRLQNDIVKCTAKDGTEVYTVSCIEKMEFNGEHYLVSSFLDITKIIEQQRLIERQHKEILESINYARHIQNAIFPTQEQIEEILPESFVLAKPKNIVSGDFYWIKKLGNKIFVAACDCTGHGVPGALISIIGFKLLSKFITEYAFSNPAQILNQLNKEFFIADKKTAEHSFEIKDGMDIALRTVDKTIMMMRYAGAYNPIYLVRKGKLSQLAVDKIPIHLFSDYTGQEFTDYEIKIEKGDSLYLFSDGYADQFGGPKRKKFRYKGFQDLIVSIHHLPMHAQKKIFDNTIEEWKDESGEEQTDDILIVGFKV